MVKYIVGSLHIIIYSLDINCHIQTMGYDEPFIEI